MVVNPRKVLILTSFMRSFGILQKNQFEENIQFAWHSVEEVRSFIMWQRNCLDICTIKLSICRTSIICSKIQNYFASKKWGRFDIKSLQQRKICLAFSGLCGITINYPLWLKIEMWNLLYLLIYSQFYPTIWIFIYIISHFKIQST